MSDVPYAVKQAILPVEHRNSDLPGGWAKTAIAERELAPYLTKRDEVIWRYAIRDAIHEMCSSCREGIPFSSPPLGGRADYFPMTHFKQTTTDDDGSPRGLRYDCHAVTLRHLLKKGPPKK